MSVLTESAAKDLTRPLPLRDIRSVRGAIVIAPAWETSGSGEVFKGQIETLNLLGFETYFLTAPHYRMSASEYRRRCREYKEWTQDLAASKRGEVRFPLWAWRADRKFAAEAKGKTEAFRSTWCASTMRLPRSMLQFVRGKKELVVVCNHFFNVPLAKKLQKALGEKIRFALETHDIQSRHYRARIGPMKEEAYQAMLAEELSFAAEADVLIHISAEELPIYANALPHHEHRLVYPSLRDCSDEAASVRDSTFLIVAAWNDPNADSIEWFLSSVWSYYHGTGTLRIVGDVAGLMRLRYPKTFSRWQHLFSGRVSNLAAAYYGSSVVVLPTMAGEGISIKFAEAMAYGKYVLFMPLAVRGLPIQVISDLTGRCECAAELLAKMNKINPLVPMGVDPVSQKVYNAIYTQTRHASAYAEIVDDITNQLRPTLRSKLKNLLS